MSTPSIVRGTKMNVGAIFVFGCAILIQGTNAAPAQLEAAATVNPLIQNAAAGDVLLQTPEPLHPVTSTSVNLGSATDTLTSAINDSLDQVQVGDHLLASTPTITTPTGNLSASLPTTSLQGAITTASGPSGTSTIETTTSPLDADLATASGPAITAGLPVADPMMFYRILSNLIRQPEQFMQPFYTPFSGITSTGFPSLRMPGFRPSMPNIGIMGLNDPSLKLVDQKIIDDGPVKGQFNSYEGQPDPNTVTKMQTGQFSVNKEGLQGAGVGHYYSSSSSSGSLGGNPVASVGAFFGGLPSRFSMGFNPLRLT